MRFERFFAEAHAFAHHIRAHQPGDRGVDVHNGAAGEIQRAMRRQQTAAAILAWTFGEWALRGKPSLLGACSGAIAGLVGVTPACGYIGVGGALIVGIASGLAGIWGVTALKRWLRVDDPCDVFGVHGVCGIVGCILTGIFAATSLGGVGYAEGVTMGHQLLVQLESIGITVVWSGVVAFIGYKVADMTVGLRVPEEQEREGLDVNSHGENAYNA